MKPVEQKEESCFADAASKEGEAEDSVVAATSSKAATGKITAVDSRSIFYTVDLRRLFDAKSRRTSQANEDRSKRKEAATFERQKGPEEGDVWS